MPCIYHSPIHAETFATELSTCQEWTEWGSCTRLNANSCTQDKRNRTMICKVYGGEGKTMKFQFKKCQVIFIS